MPNSRANKKCKFLSLLSLAIAVSIKPYAAVFALVLLKDRKFLEFFECLFILLVLNLIALPFFGGIDALGQIWNNVFNLSEEMAFIDGFKLDISNSLKQVMYLFGIDYEEFEILISAIEQGLVFCLLLTSLMSKSKWETTLALSLFYIMFSNVSWVYLLFFLFISLILMNGEEYKAESDEYLDYQSIMLLFIILILIPIPFGFIHLSGINDVTEAYLIKSLLLVVVSALIINNVLISKIKTYLLQRSVSKS